MPPVTKLDGKSSRKASGIGSVALVLISPHLSAGAVGVGPVDRAGVWGLLFAPRFEVGLLSEEITKIAATAATTTTATPMARRTGGCFDLRPDRDGGRLRPAAPRPADVRRRAGVAALRAGAPPPAGVPRPRSRVLARSVVARALDREPSVVFRSAVPVDVRPWVRTASLIAPTDCLVSTSSDA